jgi:hypothetical protein
MAMTPMRRSLELMRGRGFLCAITEHWNHFANIRQDLFGFGDILCVSKTNCATVILQTTSASNVSARCKKIRESEELSILKHAGWKIIVHGWRKSAKTKKWECREVEL